MKICIICEVGTEFLKYSSHAFEALKGTVVLVYLKCWQFWVTSIVN